MIVIASLGLFRRCSQHHGAMSAVAIKMSSHEKSVLGKLITELIGASVSLSYQNIAGPIHSLPIIGPSPEKSPPADNLPVKIRSARATAKRGGFLPENCRPRRLFLGGRSYNGTSAPAATQSQFHSVRPATFRAVQPTTDVCWSGGQQLSPSVTKWDKGYNYM